MVVGHSVTIAKGEADLAGFEEPKYNKKKQQRKEKKQLQQQAETTTVVVEEEEKKEKPKKKNDNKKNNNAENNSEVENAQHEKKPKVHFGDGSLAKDAPGHNRKRSSLKAVPTSDQSDVGIVKRLVDLGFAVGSVIDAIESVEKSKRPDEVTTFEKVRAVLQSSTSPSSPNAASPRSPRSPREEKKEGGSSKGKNKKNGQVKEQQKEKESKPEPTTLLGRIEHQAEEWDGSSVGVIQKWIELLNEGEHPKHKAQSAHEGSVLFLHTFLESRALEIVCRTILEGGLKHSQRSIDNSVVQLFDLTLIGKKDYHRWLLNQLKAVARHLEGSTRKEDLVAKVLLVLNNQKQHFVGHREFTDVLQQRRDELSVRKAEQSADPRSALEEVSEAGATSVRLHEDQLLHIKDAISKIMSSDELSLSFRSLERDIELTKTTAQKALEEKKSHRGTILSKRSSLDEQKRKRFDDLRTKQKNNLRLRAELEKKKADLEEMLTNVNRDLLRLESDEAKTQMALATIDDSYTDTHQSLEKKEQELAFEIAALAKDNEASDAITGFMEGVREKVTSFCQKDHQELHSNYGRIMKKYLEEVKSYVGNQQSLLKFLKERISFCRNKLAESKAERDRMAQLGIKATGSVDESLEKNMETMMKEDSAAVNGIVATVQGTFLNVKKLANVASNEYGVFYEFLHKKQVEGKLAFRMSSLPQPISGPASPLVPTTKPRHNPPAVSLSTNEEEKTNSAQPTPIIPSSLPVPDTGSGPRRGPAGRSAIERPRKPPGFAHSPQPRKVAAQTPPTSSETILPPASSSSASAAPSNVRQAAWNGAGGVAPPPLAAPVASSPSSSSPQPASPARGPSTASAPIRGPKKAANTKPKRGPMRKKPAQ